jgi:prephenate dehydrogenase
MLGMPADVTPASSLPGAIKPYSQVLIVGLGLIGGSMAMALASRLPQVPLAVVDAHEPTLHQALSQGLAQRAFPTVAAAAQALWGSGAAAEVPEAPEAGEQLVVLASHLPVNQQHLLELTPWVKGKAVTVVDLGSCKRAIALQGEHLLPQQFVGGHPMAGREKSGLQHATPLLFEGKRFLLTPPPTWANPNRLEALEGFLRQLGFVPVRMAAEEHDRTMAYMSHLPQLYAVALTNLLANNQPGRLLANHGGGIDDQLRIAASAHAMWGPVYAENSDNMRAVLDELITLLGQLRDDLESPALAGYFATANQMHEAFHQLKRPASPANNGHPSLV